MKYERNMSDYEKKKRSERAKTVADFRRQNHQCTRCGGTDEYTESGRSYCKTCLDKQRNRNRKYRQSPKGKTMMRRYKINRLKREGRYD